jgi:hypothetical protein
MIFGCPGARQILQNALGYTISGTNPLQALDVKAYGLTS